MTFVPFSHTSPREITPPLSLRNVFTPGCGSAWKTLRYHHGTLKSLALAFFRFSE